MAAIANGHIYVAKYLIDEGIDISMKNINGDSAIMFAAEKIN